MCYGAGRVVVVSLSKVYLWKSQVEGYLPRLPAPGDLIKLLTFRGQKALPFSTCSVNQFTWIPAILRNFAITTGQSCLNWSAVLSTCKVKRSPVLHLPVCSPPSCLLAVYTFRDSVQETDKQSSQILQDVQPVLTSFSGRAPGCIPAKKVVFLSRWPAFHKHSCFSVNLVKLPSACWVWFLSPIWALSQHSQHPYK